MDKAKPEPSMEKWMIPDPVNGPGATFAPARGGPRSFLL